MKKGPYEKFLPQDTSRSRVIFGKRMRHLKIGFAKGFKSIRHSSLIEFSSLRLFGQCQPKWLT